MAFKAMVGWVGETSGVGEMDAYQLVAQLARAPIIQLVDPEYTVMVKLDKRRVPARA
jgi:amidase